MTSCRPFGNGRVKVPPDLLSFRYRAQKVSQPIRSEVIGPFEILVVANDPDRLAQGRIAFDIRGGRR